MKRIAAVAALIVTMLAVPATAAMASTGGSSSGHTGQGQTVCPPPYLLHHRPHVRHLRRYYGHRHPRRSQVACAVPSPFPPPSQNCPSGYGQSFTFDVASGSSTAYEVSGPTLAAGEEFTYDGGTYTIWSVNPGANSFTMSQGASAFVNGGPDITGAYGQLTCSG
ncbi:MAG TPA: hypothetical protein VIX15_08265 [Streptosporangiaceae bacterium]